MKKKFLTGIIALSSCFVMTGCSVVTDFLSENEIVGKVKGFVDGVLEKIIPGYGEDEVEYDVEAAKEYLKAQLVDSNVQTRSNYEVVKEFAYMGANYTVTWSVDKPEAATVKVRDDSVKIKVNPALAEDTTYILTATVSDPDGNTAQVGFRRKVLGMNTTVPDVLVGAPVANTAYKFYVFQQSLQKDLYFAGDMNGYYFKTTENHEKATDIYVEYLSESTDQFYVYFNDDVGNKQYLTVTYGLGDDKAYHTNVSIESTAATVFTYSADLGTIITAVEDNTDESSVNPTDYYLGNYDTKTTISASKTSYAATSNVGKLAGMVNRSTVSDAEKVARTKREIALAAAYVGNTKAELPEYGTLFSEAKISWSTTDSNLSVDEEELTITAPSETKTATLTATITLGDVTETKEVTIKLVPNTQEAILAAATALNSGESFGNSVTLTGVLKETPTGDDAYNTTYGNVSVVMDVNGTEIEAYRMLTEEAIGKALKAGDTITVTGTLQKFYSTIEFTSGCTLDSYVAGEATDDDNDDNTEAAATLPVEGTEYYLASVNANGNIYFNGILTSERIQATTDSTAAVKVLFEKVANTENEYYLYFMNSGVKTYINGNKSGNSTDDDSTDFDYVTGSTPADTWIVDTTKKAIYSKTSDRMIATQNTSTHDNFSTYAISNLGTSGYVAAWFYTEPLSDSGSQGGSGETTTPTLTTSNISDILAGTVGNSYQAEGTVVAVCSSGFVLQDATANMFVYLGTNTTSVGDKVTVAGTTTLFKNTFLQFNKPTVTANGDGTLPTGDPTVLSTADCESLVATGSSSTIACSYVSITGTLSISDSYYNIILSDTETAQGSIYYATEAQKATLSELKDKTVTLVGYTTYISGSKYINFIMVSVEEYVKPITDADRIATELEALTLDTTAVTAEKTITLPTTPTKYDTVSITWTATKDGESMDIVDTDGVKTVTLTPGAVGSADVTVVLTATVSCGEATAQTTSFTITVKSVDPQDFVNAEAEAFALTTTTATTIAPLTLPTASTNGAAITWAIKDGDSVTEISLDSNPTADETVTLVATFTSGTATATKEFTVTKKALTAAEIVDAANALAEDTVLPGGDYTLSGVITKLSSWNSKYSSQTVTIVVDGTESKTMYCYSVQGVKEYQLSIGDSITVKGELKNFDGTIEFNMPDLEEHKATDANKIAAEINVLKAAIKSSYNEETTLTLSTVGSLFDEVSIAWTKDGKAYTAGTLTLTPADEDFTVTLVATLTIDGVEVTDNIETFEIAVNVPVAGTTYTLSFADTANRTTQTTETQVWTQNGITVTNNKSSSTTNVADTSNPVRFYKSSDVIVAYAGMTSITFVCNTASYATALKDSISDDTVAVTVDGKNVTITFSEAKDSYSISLTGGQVRVDSISVFVPDTNS